MAHPNRYIGADTVDAIRRNLMRGGCPTFSLPTVTIQVECDDCGGALNAKLNSDYVLQVELCKSCIESEVASKLEDLESKVI